MSSDSKEFTEQSFTGREVTEVLSSLPEELSGGVIERLREDRRIKEELAVTRKVQTLITDLAIAAHQNVVDIEDTPRMLDAIMWDRFVTDTSEGLLRLVGTIDEHQKAKIPESAVDWALYRYVKHSLLVSEDEEDINAVLSPLGETVDSVYNRSLELAVELNSFGGKTLEELKAEMPDPEGFAYALCLSASELDQKLEQRMRRDLLTMGYHLPELEPDNSYGYDHTKNTYIIPEIDESMFPV